MLAGWFGQSGPRTLSAQHVIDRVRHLNLVLGYLLPSLTYVLSLGTVDGANFLFRPFTDDADRIRASYEPIVRRLVSPQLDEVIVDVGANIGSHSIWFAKKVGPSGLVLAIEPESNNFTILCSNQKINHLTNVVPIKAALSSDQSVGTLVVPLPTFMGQVTTGSTTPSSKSTVVTIHFDTLDHVLSTHPVQHISTIKVDVEGAEMDVIRGATRTIANFRPRLVIEAHGRENLARLKTLLKTMGMDVTSEIRASSRLDETRWFVLAVHSSKSQLLVG